MKTSTWLRLAAIVALALGVGHMLGRPWTPVKAVEGEVVVGAMRAVHFTIQGASRSYFDFYQGLGWSSGVLALVLAVVLWRQARSAKSGTPVDRSLLAVECAGFAINAGAVGFYIAAVPAAFSAAVAVALAGALIASRAKVSA